MSTEMPSVWLESAAALHDWPCPAPACLVPAAQESATRRPRDRLGDGCGQMGDMTVAFMLCQGWGQPYRGRRRPPTQGTSTEETRDGKGYRWRQARPESLTSDHSTGAGRANVL